MRLFAFVVLTLGLAVLGKSVFGYPLLLPVVIAVGFSTAVQRSMRVAIFSGLVAGFVEGSLLGWVSLAFLVAVVVVNLVGRWLSSEQRLSAVAPLVLGSLAARVIAAYPVTVWLVVLDVLLAAAAIPGLRWIAVSGREEGITVRL